ncbi:hypothetical protein MTR67_043714 [Solanum verrucosum]|uniref:Putative plant transposon protein domain-containing protein n=1 Tax=Solanum verrucosum TaxID=315347 RepID=A0AAF0ZVE3_SOLVR|nr:hypothetical protein MTR67_043714 [Solanum verrucosum]
MARTITVEHRVLTGSLHSAPVMKDFFRRHKCEWMAWDPENYSEEMTREFYASYAATVRNSISKNDKPLAQPPLQSTLVRNSLVDISDATICRFISGPAHTLPINTVEYDYRIGIVLSGVDNVVTWDRAVMIAAIMAGLELDFSCILIAEIHERAIRTTTTLPFPFLIFYLCRKASVTIWHCDREPQVDLPPLAVDIVVNVEHIHVDDTAVPPTTTDAQVPPSTATSQA